MQFLSPGSLQFSAENKWRKENYTMSTYLNRHIYWTLGDYIKQTPPVLVDQSQGETGEREEKFLGRDHQKFSK